MEGQQAVLSRSSGLPDERDQCWDISGAVMRGSWSFLYSWYGEHLEQQW